VVEHIEAMHHIEPYTREQTRYIRNPAALELADLGRVASCDSDRRHIAAIYPRTLAVVEPGKVSEPAARVEHGPACQSHMLRLIAQGAQS
jgi:hypothetical protein